jgi:hypothetical protein
LFQAPSQDKEEQASYFTYKHKYGLLLLAGVTRDKRFAYIHHGYSARASDIRAQRATTLYLDPESMFSPGEVVIGDSGFVGTEYMVPMFRRYRGQPDLTSGQVSCSPRAHIIAAELILQTYFNTKIAPAPVAVEHAFGILKSRFRLLKSAPFRMMSDRDEQRAVLAIVAGCVLHNLLINTYKEHLTDEDLAWAIGDEHRWRRRQIRQREREGAEDEDAGETRRRKLLYEIAELDGDDITPDMLRL